MVDPAKNEPRVKLGHRYHLKGNPNQPPMGLKWVRAFDLVAKHKGAKDPKKITLQTIAALYGIRPRDLMLINWNTIQPAEVNWYLNNWAGCNVEENGQYCFSQTDSPGMILVPNQIEHATIGPTRTGGAVRNDKATLDTGLQIFVQERLPDLTSKTVEAKWLYVFSGAGLDFGFEPKPKSSWSNIDQPGSAGFTLDFPGKFNITKEPDTLEYEIYISSDKPPSKETLKTAYGDKSNLEPRFEYGRKWYFLSDQTILKNAWNEPRAKRLDKHAFRNINLVNIELYRDGQDRRYYFLLSPVQLGPEALKFAKANPSGLTPLLAPNAFHKTDAFDNKNTFDDFKSYWFGPDAKNVTKNPLTLGVADPFAWARYIAEVIFPNALDKYVDWIGPGNTKVIEELIYGGGNQMPSLEHMMVARTLESVIRAQKGEGGRMIEAELNNKSEFYQHIKIWEEHLFKTTEDLNMELNKSLIQLIDWLEGPAHKIIETAILKDTKEKTPVDALDMGCGVLHWSTCLENAYLFSPGVAYLRRILEQKGRIPFDLALRHLEGAGESGFNPSLSEFDRTVYKYAHAGAISLLTLSEIVRRIPTGGVASEEQFWKELAEKIDQKQANFLKFFNEQKLLPVVLSRAVKKANSGSGITAGVSLPVINGFLSVVDVTSSWSIDRSIEKNSLVFNQISQSDEWIQIKAKAASAKVAKHRAEWETELKSRFKTRFNNSVRVVSFVLGVYNLYSVFNAARYDYELKKYVNPSTITDYTAAVAGIYGAGHDILSMFGAKYGTRWLVTHVPDFGEFAKGTTWGITKGGLAVGVSTVGKIAVGVNALAMVVTGVTTVFALGNSADEARDLGNYTAEAFYRVGQIGGGAMIAGGMTLGIAVGLAFTGQGLALLVALTTVGSFLFIIGGFVAALAALFGAASAESPIVIFARKCFFGKEGQGPDKMQPRFGNSPPPWSLATTSPGTDEIDGSWPIKDQRRALYNLIGMSKLSTKIIRHTGYRASVHSMDVLIKVQPGYFPDYFEMEVELHVTRNGAKDTALLKWDVKENYYKFAPVQTNGVVDKSAVELKAAAVDEKTRLLKTVSFVFGNVRFDQNKDIKGKLGEGLWSTVTIRDRELGLVIGTQKEVCRTASKWDMVTPDESEKLSDFFKE